MAVAADVPGKYDVVINGKGYMFDRRPEVKAELSFTPTFLPRTNVSGAYGDNEQDYFLTATQKDWAGGEGQNFFRTDDDRSKRYYIGNGVQVSGAGEIHMETTPSTSSNPADLYAGTEVALSAYMVGTTNLYQHDGAGNSYVSKGAHGAGIPYVWGIAYDGTAHYISGSSKIRKYTAATFTDFNTDGACGAVVFHNNQLYSCDGATLYSYSSAGVRTVEFPWVGADGVARTAGLGKAKLISDGPKLYIWFPLTPDGPELWIFDGTSASMVAKLPPGTGSDAVAIAGVIYLGTTEEGRYEPDSQFGLAKSVIYAFTDSITELWRDIFTGTQTPGLGPYLAPWGEYLMFTLQNSKGSYLKMYSLRNGAVTTISSVTINTIPLMVCSRSNIWILNRGSGQNTYVWPGLDTPATATIQTSLFDFDNSLTKNFRSIKLEWTGSGGASVDISYRVGDTNGSYTSLQVGAVSGTEYPLTGVSGRSISVMLTLHYSTTRPVIKRIYVRTAPVLQSYRKGTYLLDLSGSYKGKTPVMDRTGKPIERSGSAMLTELNTALQAVSVSITDDLGTYTGALDPEQFAAQRIGPGQFLVKVGAREV